MRDIIVIGGGIAGLSAAAALAGDARVTLIEAGRQLGTQSTARSAAIFIRNYGNAVLRALNAQAYPVMSAQGWLSPRGELLLAGEADSAAFEEYVAGASGLEVLDARQASDLVPLLRPEKIAQAVYERDAQDIDVEAAVQHYARVLRAAGGKIVSGAPVARIAWRDGLWHVTADAGYSAPVLVNAAGAWGDLVADMAGVRPVGLVAKRRSAAIVPQEGAAGWPLFGSVAETWYAKPTGGALMVSPADADPIAPHDVSHGDVWADDMVLAEGLDRFSQATTYDLTRVGHSWAGLRCFVADSTPVAGFDDRAQGFFWLVGQGGYGVQTSPALAALTADLVLGRLPGLAGDAVTALDVARLR